MNNSPFRHYDWTEDDLMYESPYERLAQLGLTQTQLEEVCGVFDKMLTSVLVRYDEITRKDYVEEDNLVYAEEQEQEQE